MAQNDAEAEHWFQKGAELHNPQAQYVMGSLYFADANHEHNLNTAATLLRESAQAGCSGNESARTVARGAPKLAGHPGEATGFLKDAANAGSWMSSLLLGVLARDGKDVPRDASSAYFQFRVAVLKAETRRKIVSRTISIGLRRQSWALIARQKLTLKPPIGASVTMLYLNSSIKRR